ncbi:VOC family protein [Robertkochia aurantiaca]|uniref:VOC family protein n=1 Tax=Robertkochia aurantiaca TaxID=2873700 RepID=UPI001CCA739B|nr:VOC family protein [Robertkochia sp. 3YJGBD-33]
MRQLILFLFFTIAITSTHAQNQLTFDHEALLVQNLDESVAFYTEVLSLEEIEDGTGQPHIRWFSLGRDKSLHLIEDKDFTREQQIGIHFALRAKDLDELMTTLKNKNIPFRNWQGEKNTFNDRPDGYRQIYVQDPDGYWIEINGK